MIIRELTDAIQRAASQYPVILVTGPRQSGKTTLVKSLFPSYSYTNLEFPDIRSLAKSDPRFFLKDLSQGMIIDEVQYAPELLSYIQGLVDANGLIGKVVITGSQNFALMEKVTQSLAGRVAIFELLSLSHSELKPIQSFDNVFELIHRGGYPRLYSQAGLDHSEWFRNYFQTYIERDVRQVLNIKDIDKFNLFLRLCAGRMSQLVNHAALGNEAGIDAKTTQQWLAILRASYIIFTVQPYYENFSKRLIKTPKLYFYDTGLGCSLLQINTTNELQNHFAKGALFENWVMAEYVKYQANHKTGSVPYFWRDRTGNEIDLLTKKNNQFNLVEIKAAATYNASFFKMKSFWEKLNTKAKFDFYILYAGNSTFDTAQGKVLAWDNNDMLFEKL